MTNPKPLSPIPTTYAYVGQLQEAAKAIAEALDAASDQRQDGKAAADAVVTARQHIENVYELSDEGVTA